MVEHNVCGISIAREVRFGTTFSSKNPATLGVCYKEKNGIETYPDNFKAWRTFGHYHIYLETFRVYIQTIRDFSNGLKCMAELLMKLWTRLRLMKASSLQIDCLGILVVFPQIAIAIGVLTSKKGRGRRTTLADWTWHQAGAIVGCHCRVLWLGGRMTTNFRGVVPLLGAIVGCHCSVLWLGGRVTTNWSGRGAIAGCHCSGYGGRGVVCYGWGGGWRPTLREWTSLGEWTWCHCWVPLQGAGEGEGDAQFWGSGRSIAGCPWYLT